MKRLFSIFTILILVGFIYIACENSAPQSSNQTSPSASSSTEQRQGEAKKELGFKSVAFGSSAQAQELLNLIDENKGKADYKISYVTEGETVIFGCNFNNNIIIRIHQRKDGHGTQEMWKGDVIERLRNASGGGSLNDTPMGNKAGTFQSF